MATFISQDFSAPDGTVITTFPGWSNLSGSTGNAENLIVSGNAIRTALSSGTVGAQNSLAAAGSDMTVVVQLKCISAANTIPGVVARLLNDSNYYFARVSQSSQLCEIYKTVSGNAALINSAAFELLAGQSVEFAFEVVGSTLRVLRDGVPALSVTDSSIAAGSRVGIRWSTGVAVGASSGTHIDSFVGYDGAYVSTGDPPSGTVTISDVDPGETSAIVTYSYDDTDQTGFEYRLDGGTAASLGASPATISGLTASTEYDLEVRAINANGAGAWSAVETFTTDAVVLPTVTVTDPLKNNTGTLLASQTGIIASVLAAPTLASVHTLSGLATNGSGLLAPISHASLTTGQQYHVAIKLADGSVGITGPITAS